MNDLCARYLADLEQRINPQIEDQLLDDWKDFGQNRFHGDIFTPSRCTASPPAIDWPYVTVNAALDHWEMMVLQQYGQCSDQLAQGSGQLLNVRSNFGTSIIPLLFGVEPFIMADELDTLPTSRPLNDAEAIHRLVDAGVPDIHQGYMARVLEMGRRYIEIAEQYPRIGRYVFIYHPDLQGPMDICEVIWGSSLFYALYDQPDLVHALLNLITETYLRCMRAWMDVVPFHPDGNAHWGFYHRGNIMLRDDSAMNLSPEMFDQFVRPYDQRLLDELGGGAIHFCGRGDHYAPSLGEMRGLYAVNLSQPEYNDMETIYRNTIDKGIKIIGLRYETAQEAVRQKRGLHSQVQAFP